MPQLQLPIFHEGTHLITPDLGYQRKDCQVVYWCGMTPVFTHEVDDVASFQMIVSQFYVTGNAKQVEIVKAFGIKPLALKRWVKKYRESGPKAFYIEKRGRPRVKKKALLGLDRDRCPEAKTLRQKLKLLSEGDAQGWAAQLCEDWMQEDPANLGVLYVDGHPRVYHGRQTKLPRHYVARQRLCLRATTDYWVNGLDGLPFFKVNRAVDPGMIQVLEEEIVPRLEEQIPNQPTEAQLQEDPYRMRFRLVFDREGYSPGFFKRMKAKRIACQTYHKYPGEDWPREEFHPHVVTLMDGGQVEMHLAERGTHLGSKAEDELWVREIRKLTESGRQIAILSTDWQASVGEIVGPQFGRWSQENFFKYGRQHFNLVPPSWRNGPFGLR